jgi:hypothetical protein
LGSTRKIVKFRETVVQTSYTPPSPRKATPTTIASNSNDVSTASVGEAGDVMMMSSSQKEGILKKNSILSRKDPPEGRTTAIVAVMRSNMVTTANAVTSTTSKVSAGPVRLWF